MTSLELFANSSFNKNEIAVVWLSIQDTGFKKFE